MSTRPLHIPDPVTGHYEYVEPSPIFRTRQGMIIDLWCESQTSESLAAFEARHRNTHDCVIKARWGRG